MTRKRFIKKLMAVGFSRNAAADISKQRGDRSYNQLWRDYLFGELNIEIVLGKRAAKKMDALCKDLERFARESAAEARTLQELINAFGDFYGKAAYELVRRMK